MARVYIRDNAGREVDAASVSVPQNRKFRDAWIADEVTNIIKVDMGLARAMYHAKLANAIAKKKDELATQAALGWATDDPTIKAEVAAKVAELEAHKTNPAIDNATSPEALLAVWPEVAVGEWEKTSDKS